MVIASSAVSIPHTFYSVGTLPQLASFHGRRSSLKVKPKRSVKVGIGVAYDAVTKEREEFLEEIHARIDRLKENPYDGPYSLDDFLQALEEEEASLQSEEELRSEFMVNGTVIYTDPDGAMVDINDKAPAFLPVQEACAYNILVPGEAGIRPGLEEQFLVVGEEDVNPIVSLREIQTNLAWERCRQLQVEEVSVLAKVLSANNGGLIVVVETLEGFIPFSHLATNSNLEGLVNKEIPVKVVDLDEEEGHLVLSHRKAVAESQAQLELGTVVLGTVQSIRPYGAFIDLGNISGLLHVSQISHDRVTDVGSVLQPGDTLKVMVMSHDRERGRVSLSTKKLEPTPGDMLRNPQLVYEKAEEMAQTFKQRVAQAYALARSQSAFGSMGDLTLDLEGVLDSTGKAGTKSDIGSGNEESLEVDQ
eukprot:TRINITY_DN46_c0_g1_i2.p1 TRINITY_DN46_c0_g1~~TRINITY_DN46_c0_g1_i2.p1  ORF type:complete len:418 (+),score=74.63 TRINITY_DN46_c0_g1_i2:241-1494(+)